MQYIVCSAIRHPDGDIICGPRHFDTIMVNQIKNGSGKKWVQSDQGFVNQYGKFLTREEAWVIADRNNQIVSRCGGDEGKLFSENLY